MTEVDGILDPAVSFGIIFWSLSSGTIMCALCVHPWMDTSIQWKMTHAYNRTQVHKDMLVLFSNIRNLAETHPYRNPQSHDAILVRLGIPRQLRSLPIRLDSAMPMCTLGVCTLHSTYCCKRDWHY